MTRWIWMLAGLWACGGDGAAPVEVCDNGLDDDGDELLDCGDPDCVGVCPELCADGLDNDGDALADCADPECDGACPEDCADGRDNDGDFVIDCADADCLGLCPEDCENGIDDDGDFLPDCLDRDCNVPSCPESCGDGWDNDADGYVDCADPDCDGVCQEVCTDGRDNDGDGQFDCLDTDCDGQCPEVCRDSRDNDGDGATDCDDSQCAGRCDGDLDGYDDALGGGPDCDDADPSRHPDAAEGCDGIDNDCDGTVDDDDSEVTGVGSVQMYSDGDLDLYGAATPVRTGCVPQPGEAATADDCDDSDPARHPGATERCNNGLDDDCDGLPDDTDPGLDTSSASVWYGDSDLDGYGDPATSVHACLMPRGYVANADDCQPLDPQINLQTSFYLDDDGDGYGSGAAVVACLPPAHAVPNTLDCDDTDPELNPDTPWYLDADIDGFGDPETITYSCTPVVGYSRDDSDCDDADRAVNPNTVWFADLDRDGFGDAALSEVACEPAGPASLDDTDCDDRDPDVLGLVPWLRDGDHDGYGAGTPVERCTRPPAHVLASAGTDCDDLEPTVHPGASEVCADTTDQDCDGLDPICHGPLVVGDVTVSAVGQPFAGEAAGDEAASSLAGVGDVNGDGFLDLAVGSPHHGSGGAAYLLYGPFLGGRDLALADARLMAFASNDQAGWDVAAAGDMNADGYADLVVGAPQADAGSDGGAAYLIYGPVTGDRNLSLADAILDGETVGDRAGSAVGGGGDVDGDGFDDVFVGAPTEDEAGEAGGAVYLVRGPPVGRFDLAASEAKLLGPAPGALAGSSFTTGFDADGDGLTDVAVGVQLAGTTFIVAGPISGTIDMNAAATWRVISQVPGDLAGSSVSTGDLDGDGIVDLLVGAPNDAEAGLGSGAAFVVPIDVPGDIFLSAATVKVVGEQLGIRTGISVSFAGDVNSDGFDDLLVGADWDGQAGVFAGAAHLVLGPVSGVIEAADADTTVRGVTGDRLGLEVGRGGDLDADGYDDALVGAPMAASNTGTVWLLYGNAL